MPLRVQDPSDDVRAMGKGWAVAEALLGGTEAMRAAGKTHLPKEPRETEEDYAIRLATATLFPVFRRTVGVMASKPFSKPVTFSDDVPAKMLPWLESVDSRLGNGRNFDTFLAEVAREAMGFGTAGVLVEHPKRKPGDPNTIATDVANNYRPYTVFIRHGQVLGWIVEIAEGTCRLLMLRLSETVEVADGEYSTKCVKRVRVLRPGSWEIHQEGEKAGEYSIVEAGVTSLSEIPYVTFYGRQTGFMTGVSPLGEVAHLNVKHWQHQSDQDDSARFARKRLLVVSGVSKEELESVTVASGYALRFDNPDSSVSVVQGSAESVTVGRTELVALEGQMIQAGAELLVKVPGQARTATESNNDAEANKCELQLFAAGIEDGADRVLQFMADFVGEETGGKCTLFSDYGAGSLSDASAQLILSMNVAGKLSDESAFREQQRRGEISQDLTWEDERERIAAQGPALGLLTEAAA